MRKLVVAGGTGFIGSVLVEEARASGREVLVLSRTPGDGQVVWDGATVGPWVEALEGAHAVVNLAGKPINTRWTDEAKAEIIKSRVEPTNAIGMGIQACTNPPKSWINASAVGIYGNRGEELISESSELGDKDDFLVESCTKWEAAAKAYDLSTTSQAILRIGFVLGSDGGALPLLATFSKLFLGGPIGSGRQYVSWIHVRDLARMILWAIDTQTEGIVNGTGPTPVQNRKLMAEIGKVLGRPSWPPVPALAIKAFGAVSGTPPELALYGQRVVPKKALRGNFEFEFPDLHEALYEALKG